MGHESYENNVRLVCKMCSKVVFTNHRYRKYCDDCSPWIKVTGKATIRKEEETK